MLSWENYWPDHVCSEVTEAEINGRRVHVYKGMADSLYHALRRTAARLPDKTAVEDDMGNSFSYAQLLDLSDKMAAVLQDGLGVRKGDHVGILLFNGIEFCVSYLAVNKIGAVAVPLPGKFQKPEILSLIEKAEVAAVVCEEKFEPWIAELTGIKTVVSKDSGNSDLEWSWNESKSENDAEPQGTWEDAAVLMFTSGTTSRSKGVVMKNYHVMNSVEAYRKTLNLSEADSSVIATPMYHVTGMICILSVFLTVGGTVFIMRRVDPDRMLTCFIEKQITFYHASPTVFSMLLEKREMYPEIPSMKGFACGSGNMAPENIRKLKEWMPQAQFHTVYGMTETAGAGTIFPQGAADSPWIGASGVPMPDLQVKIVDDSGEELRENEIGEICLRGSFVLDEYYHQQTDLISEEGWLKTGDLGCYNQEGFLYVVDRKKDMINAEGKRYAALILKM
ncbi:class I adenylate-forming enzyme family protein [Clostridium sp. AM58-1XD]|uniref:class I adenylate-forming enzyme family protein n=1 Tax=Clostridium sp. AM58-1XD TaxID=2292307 RepID=UPI001FA89185|nr:class I adenylate-forming enzyme family protein [Clostridium sp. AM58-1XD]